MKLKISGPSRKGRQTRAMSFQSIITLALLAFLALLAMVFNFQNLKGTGIIISSSESFLTFQPTKRESSSFHDSPKKEEHLKIAVISGFIFSNPNAKIQGRRWPIMDYHLKNQVCYADRWGYDYIFNTTEGYTPEESSNYWWLEYGTWHRVAHMQAALPNYDWIVYVDNDLAFQNMNKSLESFIYKWEAAGLTDVSVFVPKDTRSQWTFSAYAVMIKNNAFGRRLLEHWNTFAHSLCPMGNFEATKPKKYNWWNSDQPGLWYSLAKTHSEFYNQTFDFPCDTTKGILDVPRYGGPIVNNYFKYIARQHNKQGHDGDYLEIFKKDQPIIWSWLGLDNTSNNGLALQQTFGPYQNTDYPGNFAIHRKQGFRIQSMKDDLHDCIHARGCYFEYDMKNATSSRVNYGCHRKRGIVN